MHHALPTVTMAAFALSLWIPGHAAAATIERYSDPVMGCGLLLSGAIEEGDAQKLREILENIDPTTQQSPAYRGGVEAPSFSKRKDIGGQGLWSVSRGLARGLADRCEYKRMMDMVDSPAIFCELDQGPPQKLPKPLPPDPSLIPCQNKADLITNHQLRIAATNVVA